MLVFPPLPLSPLPAVSEQVAYRISSELVDSFTDWWQMPILVLGVTAVLSLVLWIYHHDAAGVPRWQGVPLAVLRVGFIGILLVALLDLQRTAEHELRFPSRVAVLVDSSASMTLAANNPSSTSPSSTDAAESRATIARKLLADAGLVDSLRDQHEVAVWQFSNGLEPVTVFPLAASESDPAATNSPSNDWQNSLLAQGSETQLGEALLQTLRREQGDSLAGILLLTDGGNNAGVDPLRAAAACADAGVAVHPIGLGSEYLPSNVRVADLLIPARVFPGDRFSVTGYLQSQGLEGQTARVELILTDETSSSSDSKDVNGTILDTTEVRLAGDGDLLAVRFDLDGLNKPGSRALAIRVVPPAADSRTGDNLEAADIEVVDSAMNVLLLAGGPGREYRFLRNVLTRDRSFAVDVLLGSARPGLSQDARQILTEFPATAEALDAYDVVVAIDCDWQQFDAAAHARLERWVSRDSGGLLLMAGGVLMESWLTDNQ